MERSTVERLGKKGKMIRGVAGALAVAYCVTVVLLLLLAFLLLKFQPDSQKAEIGIFLAYAASCFLGGLYSGRKAEKKKFLWGLLTGALYVLLLLAVSGMGERQIQTGPAGIMTAALLCMAGGMLGGMMAP